MRVRSLTRLSLVGLAGGVVLPFALGNGAGLSERVASVARRSAAIHRVAVEKNGRWAGLVVGWRERWPATVGQLRRRLAKDRRASHPLKERMWVPLAVALIVIAFLGFWLAIGKSGLGAP